MSNFEYKKNPYSDPFNERSYSKSLGKTVPLRNELPKETTESVTDFIQGGFDTSKLNQYKNDRRASVSSSHRPYKKEAKAEMSMTEKVITNGIIYFILAPITIPLLAIDFVRKAPAKIDRLAKKSSPHIDEFLDSKLYIDRK